MPECPLSNLLSGLTECGDPTIAHNSVGSLYPDNNIYVYVSSTV